MPGGLNLPIFIIAVCIRAIGLHVYLLLPLQTSYSFSCSTGEVIDLFICHANNYCDQAYQERWTLCLTPPQIIDHPLKSRAGNCQLGDTPYTVWTRPSLIAVAIVYRFSFCVTRTNMGGVLYSLYFVVAMQGRSQKLHVGGGWWAGPNSTPI